MEQRNTSVKDIVFKNTLFVIPAYHDGDEDALFLMPLNGKPVFHYVLDTAQKLVPEAQICVSSNHMSIIKSALNYGQKIPFKLPSEIAVKKEADIDEIVLHALDHYARKSLTFDKVIILSPHTPFCTAEHILEACALFDKDTEMVTSVSLNASDHGVFFIENADGFLEKNPKGIMLNGHDTFRYNHVFSILRATSIRQHPRSFFSKTRKYLLNKPYATKISKPEDIAHCEQLIQEGYVLG